MEFSVLIPVFNGQQTIQSTLDSVLAQSLKPKEILVLNDGSTDQTATILESFGDKITALHQSNRGISASRNALVRKAQGDLLAFLDADDLWHPDYLRSQLALFERHPSAIASYMGHLNFHGNVQYRWLEVPSGDSELIPPLDFFVRYNRSTANFGSMSYCCVRRKTFASLGATPFQIDSVEDSCLAYQLALLGPIAFGSAPLVAYRITEKSLSADHVKSFSRWVSVFELLQPQFEQCGDVKLLHAFRCASAAKRRALSRMLMGAQRPAEARRQLRRSVVDSFDPLSLAKSALGLAKTYLPEKLQPHWPTGARR